MKYNDNNKPIVCMMTNSTCYKGTTKGTPVGVLWHSTGANNPLLKRYVQPSSNDPNYQSLIKLIGKNTYNNDFNHIDRQAGVNAWIGKLADGSVAAVQSMPWDYRPWGCGTGSKGSCNGKTGGPFWIQFEMCEDNLNNKEYFNKIYKEACEFTAYVCKMFNINPKGTVNYNGVKVPTILCHYDSYKLGLGSGHYDVYNWFNKYGKTMDNVRSDVETLIKKSSENEKIYRVRLTWEDKSSQIGAYNKLENAIANCPKNYSVFDENGVCLYKNESVEKPDEPKEPTKDNDKENQKIFDSCMETWLDERSKKKPSNYSEEARLWAEKNGLIAGYSDGSMAYKSFITREEFITILYRYNKLFNKDS